MWEQIQDLYDLESLEGVVILDDLDEAIIGIDEESMRLIYSAKRCIHSLFFNSGMTMEEAKEYFEYNTVRAIDYMGEQRPILCRDEFLYDD